MVFELYRANLMPPSNDWLDNNLSKKHPNFTLCLAVLKKSDAVEGSESVSLKRANDPYRTTSALDSSLRRHVAPPSLCR